MSAVDVFTFDGRTGELVSARADRRVAGPHDPADPVGHLHEQIVADTVLSRRPG